MYQATQTPASESDRRTFRRVVMLTVPPALAVLLCLPNGPLLKAYTAPSESMMPELMPGTYFLASRLSYGLSRFSYSGIDLPIESRWPQWQPQRGDVVTFKHPKYTGIDYVDRVIALPGERVALKSGRLILNGVEVRRKSVEGRDNLFLEFLPDAASHAIVELQKDAGDFDTMAEVAVPEGHVFVMGDNRDNSVDSRVSVEQGGVGMVPMRNIIGKLVCKVGS